MKFLPKVRNKLLMILLIVLLAFVVASCSMDIEYAEPKVASISVYSLSKVDGYVAGDEIDFYGAKILVIYDNGVREILDLTKDMIDYSNLDMTEPEDEKAVTVVYKGVKTSFTISVSKWNFKKVELTSLPHKTIYVEGEAVNPAGGELSVFYDGDNIVKKSVTKDMLEGYSNAIGKRSIKINYFGAENLIFEVEFLRKTAVKMEILRPPYQVSVFQNYGERLSRDDMKIKLIYDNQVAEVYENAMMKSGSNTETVSRERTRWKDNIEDNLHIYIDDTVVDSAVTAKVAYKDPTLEENIEYKFTGTARVKVGDIVNPTTILATTDYLEDIKSKSEGVVTAASSSGVTVSRKKTYTCNTRFFEEGDLVLKEELIGKQAGSNVVSEFSGIVTRSTGGEITVMALPIGVFDIAVTDRRYESMEIIETPISRNNASSIYNIIQGDTLNLETGFVKVKFDNGETATYSMGNAAFIKVINASTNLRRQIPGFSFKGVGNVTNVPAGANYDLLYDFEIEEGYSYPPDVLKTVVSVLDETGNINVSNNRTIVPQAAKNYTVSIVVTYTPPAGEKLISEASYILATVGAQSQADRLDITAAGNHTLRIIYGGDVKNYIEMDIYVEQKVPTRIIIDSETDNIGQHNFYRGDALPFNTISYRLEYSNGDIDELATGVTRNMVSSKSEYINDALECTEIGSDQFIDITIPNSSVQSQRLYFNVVPLPISSLTVIESSRDQFLTGKGINNGGISGVTAIDLSGANILVSYLNGITETLQDEEGNDFLNRLFNNGKNDILPNIKITYNAADELPFTEQEIYGEQKKHYIASVTYTDRYGQSATTNIKYFIVEKKPTSIKVSAVQDSALHYKSDYVQCEDWDLTGISIIATYDGEGGSTITETVDAKPYMIYHTDTNTIGNGFPLVIRYLGMLEENPSLTFNVREREETGIEIRKTGNINYVTTGSGLDLSEFQFAIKFNAGTSQIVNGIYSFAGSATKRGWWYEVFDAEIPAGEEKPVPILDNFGKPIRSSMRLVGHKMIRLAHTSEYEIRDAQGKIRYNVNYVDFFIFVDISEVKIAGIRFDDTTEYEGQMPVLGRVAKGMPLVYTYYDFVNSILKEKMLTILYEDNTVGHIEFTNSDVGIDYSSSNHSLGYRTVNINYDKFRCELYVLVIDAALVEISLTNVPTTNFINGEDFSIDGGILCATYKENGTEYTFNTYVLMNSQTKLLSYDDVDCVIPYYDENDEYIQYMVKTINIKYGTTINNKSTDYSIKVYNKQDVTFTYSDVVFFYGNSSGATVTAHQLIDGFILPTEDDPKTYEDETKPNAIRMFYASIPNNLEQDANAGFYYMTPQEYEIAKLTNPNLVQIVLWDDDNDREIIAYYDLSKVSKYNNVPSRPYIPAAKGYTYYILMMVDGNTYYRTRNYCFQVYTIIPKVIEVNVVSANENAFVLRVFTSDNPTAVKGLYNDINSINSAWTSAYSYIQKIELASPNRDYFEILMTVTTDYNDTNYAQVVAIFNAIRGQIQNYQKDGKKVIINDTKTAIIKGVNVAEYNGGQPDYITYTVASGETLTYYNILDLLEGKLEITVPIDGEGKGIFGIGDYSINNNNLTLGHNNYNITLVTPTGTVFRVKKNIVESMIVTGNEASGDYEITDEETLIITEGDEIIINVIIGVGKSRQINYYEMHYYTQADCRPEDLVVGELVAREELYYAKLDLGYYLKYDEGEGIYKEFGFRFKIKVNPV